MNTQVDYKRLIHRQSISFLVALAIYVYANCRWSPIVHAGRVSPDIMIYFPPIYNEAILALMIIERMGEIK